MHPTIFPFFDPATWTVTYVVYQEGRTAKVDYLSSVQFENLKCA